MISVSLILADKFMAYIEELTHYHSLFNKLVYWYRYVEDIKACFEGTNKILKIF